VCIEHEARECFKILNPDVYAEDYRLEELYNYALEQKSEKIIALWDDGGDESENIFEDIEFNMFKENKPESIKG
jgi:GT2 family glycosyltransferase